jgi:hypothetical protein
VRIVDLAKNLIALADADSEIVFTGLRPGEKLDEELFGDYESDDVQVHDQISRVRVPALALEAVPPSDAPQEAVEIFVDDACAFRTEEIPVVTTAVATAEAAVTDGAALPSEAALAPVAEAALASEAAPVPARARMEVQQHAG